MINTSEKISALQQQYAAVPGLSFTEKYPGFVFIDVQNRQGSASISLYGAQIMAFTPTGEKPVLWESAAGFRTLGKPLRGGVPICWPWFGAHPSDDRFPAHGLARLHYWELTSASTPDENVTTLELTLTDTEATRQVWPHAFKLSLRVSIGKILAAELITTNTGSQPFHLTEALHTYFAVSDVKRVLIKGFDGSNYIDTLDNQIKTQNGDITFTAETDRIYLDAASDSHIVDPSWQRIISNHRTNSASSVVWNPWIAKSIRMPDFGDQEYPFMVCVETANVREAGVTVAPGEEHRLGMSIQAMPLL